MNPSRATDPTPRSAEVRRMRFRLPGPGGRWPRRSPPPAGRCPRRPGPVHSRRGRSESSSCSCKAGSARSIRSTTSRAWRPTTGKTLAFDDARVLANTGMRGSPQRVMKSPWKFAAARCIAGDGSPTCSRRSAGTSTTSASCTASTPKGSRTVRRRCSCTAGRRTASGRRWARGLLYGLGTENENLPGSSRSHRRPATAARGTTATRSCRPSTRGLRWVRPAPRPTGRRSATCPTRSTTPRPDAGSSTCSATLNAEQLACTAGRLRTRGGRRVVRAGLADAGPRPGVARPRPASRGRRCQLYGIGDPATDDFGRQCLLARRMSRGRASGSSR